MESAAQPIPPRLRQSTWWTRNWKWLVPLGCIAVLVLLVGFITSIVTVVFTAMKSSDAYKGAVRAARADPRVTNAIGWPIKEGVLVSGNINVSGPSGRADLAIPISGSKGKATIYVEATKAVGQWNFSNLVVQVDGASERIDLNEKKVDGSVR